MENNMTLALANKNTNGNVITTNNLHELETQVSAKQQHDMKKQTLTQLQTIEAQMRSRQEIDNVAQYFSNLYHIGNIIYHLDVATSAEQAVLQSANKKDVRRMKKLHTFIINEIDKQCDIVFNAVMALNSNESFKYKNDKNIRRTLVTAMRNLIINKMEIAISQPKLLISLKDKFFHEDGCYDAFAIAMKLKHKLQGVYNLDQVARDVTQLLNHKITDMMSVVKQQISDYVLQNKRHVITLEKYQPTLEQIELYNVLATHFVNKQEYEEPEATSVTNENLQDKSFVANFFGKYLNNIASWLQPTQNQSTTEDSATQVKTPEQTAFTLPDEKHNMQVSQHNNIAPAA